MGEPVFSRLAELAARRRELEELSATPAEFRPLSRKQLEELRHMARPPQVVRECLEVVYLCLHVEAAGREIQRLPASGRLPVGWRAVQAMLARFEGFFPAMRHYDIAPLVAAPAVAAYIGRTYFGESGLTEGRVQRCSSACAGLFRWCGTSLSRVRAALQLLEVEAEVAALRQSPARWRFATDDGWEDYPGHVHEQLEQAASQGGAGVVTFELRGEHYEVDVSARCQRNRSSGFARPVRPPGTAADLSALQGTWRLSLGGLATVRGSLVRMNGMRAGENLQVLPSGAVAWDFQGATWLAEGDPLRVVWRRQDVDDEVAWLPAAKHRPNPLPPLPAAETPRPDTARSMVSLPESARSIYRAEGGQERWVCKIDRGGWAEFPADVDERLREAEERGGAVDFELNGQCYRADLATRTQRNIESGFLRPIRPPPGVIVDLSALQGLWDAREGVVAKIRVRGAVVFLDGQESQARLEPRAMGSVQWRFQDKLLCASGSPLKVVWKHDGDSQMAWTPTARA